MARKTLYQRLDNLGVSVAAEYDALIRLLKVEQNIFNYRFYPLIHYINKNYFRDLPADFRSPYLSVEEMMQALDLRDKSASLDDLFLLSELLIALLPEKHIKKKEDLYQQAITIFENIFSFLEKLNYELKEIDGGRKIIVEKNPATTQAVEIVTDNSTAIALIEYNHYALKGDLEETSRILTALGSYIEPVLKSRVLQNAGYKQLESDVGFMLNNFHVRHNNKEGAKAQDYIVGLNNRQLEEWYDHIYNAILSVIIINEHIPVQNNIVTLKSTYIWRT
jgi:hypothetical protein